MVVTVSHAVYVPIACRLGLPAAQRCRGGKAGRECRPATEDFVPACSLPTHTPGAVLLSSLGQVTRKRSGGCLCGANAAAGHYQTPAAVAGDAN